MQVVWRISRPLQKLPQKEMDSTEQPSEVEGPVLEDDTLRHCDDAPHSHRHLLEEPLKNVRSETWHKAMLLVELILPELREHMDVHRSRVRVPLNKPRGYSTRWPAHSGHYDYSKSVQYTFMTSPNLCSIPSNN